MVEEVEISIFFDNTHKKYHILAGILSFVFMKKFAYRTEDSAMSIAAVAAALGDGKWVPNRKSGFRD